MVEVEPSTGEGPLAEANRSSARSRGQTDLPIPAAEGESPRRTQRKGSESGSTLAHLTPRTMASMQNAKQEGDMQINATHAAQEHLQWLNARDHHVHETLLQRKISEREIILAESESVILGWLRYGYFWDSIPFMNMLQIAEAHRRKGIGKQLMHFWESEMKKREHTMVMTSSQSDEDAQHFYRKLGYAYAGSLTLPGAPLEVIFIKRL